jgi:hypothetical protein
MRITLTLLQVLIIVSTVFLSLCVQHGFGGDLTKLPKADSELVLKYIAIQIPLVTFSTTIARTGFIIYLLAVLGTNKNYKIALWVVLAIQAAGNIVSAVLPLSICRDVRALWDLEAAMHTTCGDTAAVIKFAYYSNSMFNEPVGEMLEHRLIDLQLSTQPLIFSWRFSRRWCSGILISNCASKLV